MQFQASPMQSTGQQSFRTLSPPKQFQGQAQMTPQFLGEQYQFLPPPNSITNQAQFVRRPNQVGSVRAASPNSIYQQQVRSPTLGSSISNPMMGATQPPVFYPPGSQQMGLYGQIPFQNQQIINNRGMPFNQFGPQAGMLPPQPIFLGHRLIGQPQPYIPINPDYQPAKNIDFHI